MEITSTYDKELLEFREHIFEFTKAIVEKHGKFEAILVVLCKVEKEKEPRLVVIPVNAMMQNSETKDFLAWMIPKVFEKIVEDGKTPLGFSLCSEVWTLSARSKDEIPKNGISEHPEKQEGIMTTFETEYSSDIVVRRILRNGDKVTVADASENDFNFKKARSVSGRFMNLFRKTHSNN